MNVSTLEHTKTRLNDIDITALDDITKKLVQEYEHKQLKNKVKRTALSKSPLTYARRPTEIKKIPRAELIVKMQQLALKAFMHTTELPLLVEKHGLEVVHLIAAHGPIAAQAIKRYGEKGVTACKLRGVSGALDLIQRREN